MVALVAVLIFPPLILVILALAFFYALNFRHRSKKRVDGRSSDEFLSLVEDLFCVRLSGAEREACVETTEGPEIVGAKLPLVDGAPIMGKAVGLTRAAIVDVLGAADDDLAATTRLEDLLPRRGRGRAWRRLCQKLELETWPRLEAPPWITRAALIIFAAALISIPWRDAPAGPALVVAAAAVVLGVAVGRLCARRVSPNCATVGALAEYVVLDPHLRQQVNGDDASWSLDQIREALTILAEPPSRWGEVFD